MSSLSVSNGDKIYLRTFTRQDDDKSLEIPVFQFSWKTVDGTVGEPLGSIDNAWSEILSMLERKFLVTETDLVQLDTDPISLFGIDDPVTQNSIERLKLEPVLMISGSALAIDDWFRYLRADPIQDSAFKWIVESFAASELPYPWRSYIGLGSIVCFNSTGDPVSPNRSDKSTGPSKSAKSSKNPKTSWKHPFYDYFEKLMTLCRTGSLNTDQIRRLRVNRLLWSFSVAHASAYGEVDILVSPKHIEELAQIFGIDLTGQSSSTPSVRKIADLSGRIVRVLRLYLVMFAGEYRLKDEVDLDHIALCGENLLAEKEKWLVMSEIQDVDEETNLPIKPLLAMKASKALSDISSFTSGKIKCIECLGEDPAPASRYCANCGDFLCSDCCTKLHSKGKRSLHSILHLQVCCSCNTLPAKSICSATDRKLCHPCFALKHINQLDDKSRERPPHRIDYEQLAKDFISLCEARDDSEEIEEREKTTKFMQKSPYTYSDNLSEKQLLASGLWHPFYDNKGTLYFYNFQTREQMRRKPMQEVDPDLVTDEQAAAAAEEVLLKGFGQYPRMPRTMRT